MQTSHAPVWRRIYDELATEIARQVHPPGSRMPPEGELAQRFGVNRHTVRRAMAALQDDGVVRIERGRGTFVQEQVIDYPITRRTRFSDIIVGADREPQNDVLRLVEEPAAGEAAEELAVVEGAPLLVVETIRMADRQPLSITAHHFPKDRFDGLIEVFRETLSITQALYRLGVHDYFRRSSRVRARLPSEYEARHLQQPATQPVLEVHSVNVDPQGRPIEFALARYCAQRVQLVFAPT